MDFPDSPVINDIHIVGIRSWIWTGTVWEAIASLGPSGPEGPQGPEGPEGPSHPINPMFVLGGV